MLNEVKRRLALLEAQNGSMVTLHQAGSGMARIPSKRLYGVCLEAFDGMQTADARAVLTAMASDEPGGMVGLLQAVCGGPMCNR